MLLLKSSKAKLTNQEYINKINTIIKKSKYFSVRDKYSYNTLINSCGCDEKSIDIISDIIIANKELKYIRKDNKNKISDVGVIWIPYDENLEKLTELLKNINKNYSIHLIPFYEYYNFDTITYTNVLEQNKMKNVIIEKYCNDIEGICNTLKKCDIIISMRYHGILLSNLLNIPSISICYNNHPHYYNKIKYLSEVFDDGGIINLSDFNSKNINEIIKNKYKSYKSKEKIVKKMKKSSCKEITNIIGNIV